MKRVRNIRVFHVMRTYGRNGGEKQLAQMFAQPAEGYDERFVFVYRDPPCKDLLRQRSRLVFRELWPVAIRPRYSPWSELLILLPLLPILQLRLMWILLFGRCRVAVVHGFQGALVAWPAAALFRWIGFAYVHRITKSSQGSSRLFRWVYAPYRRLAGVSVAVTESLRLLAPSSKLMPIENGVDISQFQSALSERKASDKFVVISIGRLLVHKGHELTLRAFVQVLKEVPTAELWIVGDGEDGARLDSLVNELGLQQRARLLGRREDIPVLLQSAALFVHASEWEGMSNSVLEAMAAGLPSVVATAPGVTECHEHGKTGLVVARNAGAMAQAIISLANDASARVHMGLAARHRAETRYSMPANRSRYIALYRQLTGR